jgi:hypothetical protein
MPAKKPAKKKSLAVRAYRNRRTIGKRGLAAASAAKKAYRAAKGKNGKKKK